MHPETPKAPSPGFTLMELVVVLAIIAVVAAVIIPEMRGTREAAVLRASGRKLLSASSLAYSQAVVRNQTHRVTLDSQTGRYAIERQSEAGRGGRSGGFAVATDLPNGGRGEIDSRVRVEFRPIESDEDLPDPSQPQPNSPSGPALVFHADGTADAVEVLLRDTAGYRLAFRLNPVTARLQPVNLERP